MENPKGALLEDCRRERPVSALAQFTFQSFEESIDFVEEVFDSLEWFQIQLWIYELTKFGDFLVFHIVKQPKFIKIINFDIRHEKFTSLCIITI